jgi:hypothetical protein
MVAIMESGACTPAASWLHDGMLRLTAAAMALMCLACGCSSGTPSAPKIASTVTVNEQGDPARAWVAAGAAGTGAPARPGWSDDWAQWVSAAQATPLSALTVLLTVEGAKVSTVRVKVLAKRPPVAGTQYVVVGTDPLAQEKLEFDLDGSLEARPAPAEGDTIAVTVQTQQCDCDFVIELSLADGGGTKTVDNNGKPFRVSSSTATTGRCVTYPDRVERCETF